MSHQYIRFSLLTCELNKSLFSNLERMYYRKLFEVHAYQYLSKLSEV